MLEFCWNISLDIECTALASQPLGYLVRGFEGLVLGSAVWAVVWFEGCFCVVVGEAFIQGERFFCSLICVRLCALARSIEYFLTYNNMFCIYAVVV